MSSVKMTVDRLPGFLKAIKELSSKQVMVGIPSSTADRKPDPDEPNDPINNAAIGYIMENGAPEVNIPARPWLNPGIASAKDEIADYLKKAAVAALDGKSGAAEKGLNGAGLMAQNAARKKIVDGPFAPLAPATLADRLRRGRTGDKPLIDTGQLKNAVTYVVRPRVKG